MKIGSPRIVRSTCVPLADEEDAMARDGLTGRLGFQQNTATDTLPRAERTQIRQLTRSPMLCTNLDR